jgi:hypothetical protein
MFLTHCCVCNKELKEDQDEAHKGLPFLSLDLKSAKHRNDPGMNMLAFHIACFEAVAGEFYSNELLSQMIKVKESQVRI